MSWFSKPLKYVFIQRWSNSPEKWERKELYSQEPLMAKLYSDEFLYLLPDGKVEGNDIMRWRPDGPVTRNAERSEQQEQ